MQYDQSVLTSTEKRIFALRTLYSSYGYRPYRMMKFEEYDLYSRYKDFLPSDRIITFTDTNGRLKALKPDVTLSIVRNIEDKPMELQRLYYDENVYRVSGRTNTFREIMQMGLECIGAANNPSVTEVLDLAEKSLAIVAEDLDYVLKVSDLDLLTPIVESLSESRSLRNEILRLAGNKNLHGIRELCKANDIPEADCAPLIELLGLYGTADEVLSRLPEICAGTGAEDEVAELEEVLRDFGSDRHMVLDFSITGDINYYNGIAFAGYVEGIPESVLIGGRYDLLMRRMKKKSRAIGFAVYLDSLARLGRSAGDDSIDYFYGNIPDRQAADGDDD